ncbi:MAG TPA: hypothetical protein VFV40_02545 [Nocardioides sp.]|nr:hypothetical protein [Nocardioides sp.]
MRTRAITVSLLLAAGLTLTACGEDAEPAAEPSPSPTTATSSETPSEEPQSEEPEPETEGTVVVVTIKGDRIEPNGAAIEADLDEPVVLAISSDRAGELHVHSTPEQFVEFRKGSHEYELTFEQPGVVEVEDHDTGFVIAQLQVS